MRGHVPFSLALITQLVLHIISPPRRYKIKSCSKMPINIEGGISNLERKRKSSGSIEGGGRSECGNDGWHILAKHMMNGTRTCTRLYPPSVSTQQQLSSTRHRRVGIAGVGQKLSSASTPSWFSLSFFSGRWFGKAVILSGYYAAKISRFVRLPL